MQGDADHGADIFSTPSDSPAQRALPRLPAQENTPEQVAYNLMHEIAAVERIAIHGGDLEPRWTRAGRAWILDTYQECLYAVRNPKKPAHLR